MAVNWQAALARAKAALIRRGRTARDADDLVQEAWIRLARYEREQTVDKPEAFLMRTALNLSDRRGSPARRGGPH
jgi:DNA-directed RNA polymerase specialized sigma24 family protein